MRLVDLEPRWLVKDGRRVGFMFRCPLTAKRPTEWQTCFVEKFRALTCAECARRDIWACEHSQTGIVAAAMPEISEDQLAGHVQMCEFGTAWTVAGGIENATFETISVTPSLDGSKGGNWHGFITNGEIVGGI